MILWESLAGSNAYRPSVLTFPVCIVFADEKSTYATICRQSKLWRPTTCIVGLLWGESSCKAALTSRQMYMSKCQHCHSEKILPTACHSKAVFTNCLTNSPPPQVGWIIFISWSCSLLRYLIWTEVCALSPNPIPLVPFNFCRVLRKFYFPLSKTLRKKWNLSL